MIYIYNIHIIHIKLIVSLSDLSSSAKQSALLRSVLRKARVHDDAWEDAGGRDQEEESKDLPLSPLGQLLLVVAPS